MLPREILKEYNQEKTAQNFGKKLFLRYFQDLEQTPGAQTVTGIPMETWLQQNELEEKINDPDTAPEDKVKLEQTLEKLKNKVVYKLLKTFEDIDPTNNKEYVQWLVRTYINDQTSIEDIGSTVAEYLAKFNTLKIKRHIKPPKNDVGQYKSFSSFLDEVDQYQDPLADEKDKKAERGKYEVMYDADNLLVLKPKDKTAACFFGRGTRWCTAATRGSNYFSHYNRQGPMYIIIPRKPEHPGEKYQFHFDSNQFAEESDRMLNNGEKLQLVTKYPQLAEIFKPQAEEHGLFWLQKPIVKKDEKYTLYIYKKDNQPYLRIVPKEPGHEGEEYFIEKNRYREDDVTVSNEKNDTLSPVERYNFAERFPELMEKLGIDFDGYNPKTSEKIQGENKTSVKFGENYIIVNTSDGQYLISGGGDDTSSRRGHMSRGVTKWNPESTSSYNRYTGLNPYEFMIEHPEINTMLQDKLNQIQNDTRDGMQRHGDNESYKYGWMAPHSSLDINNGTIYEFGQNGKAVVYYIKDNAEPDSGVALSMSPNGEVDKVVTVDQSGNTNTLTFLQQVAFMKKYPELKQLLPNVDSFNPKSIDLGNAVLEEYNTEKSRDGREVILKENYFLTPKEPSVPGEKYSLSVTYVYDIDPATNELYNKRYVDIESYAFRDDQLAPRPLTATNRYSRNEGKDLALLIGLTQKYPKLKDYIDYSKSVQRSSGYRGYRRSLGQTIDNDRVKIERYDEIDSAGDATSHGTPTLLVNDKKTGDSYIVKTYVRDQRGKTGKIGRIDVIKVPNNIVNWDADPDRRELALASEQLKEADVLALFRKFPEMVDIIKAENIHPKTPHPALVKVPVDDEELRVTTDNFRVERKPDDKSSEYILFKDEDKPNLLVVYPDRFYGYYGSSNEDIPSRIEVGFQENQRGNSGYRNTIRYGSDEWYDLMSENPDLKEYFTDKATQEKIAVAGAGKPTEIKNITDNVREYVFNGTDGKLLYFVPITNPVKDSASDTKETKWFSNGVAVPIAPGNTSDSLIGKPLINDPTIKKEIADQADEAHGESRVPHYSSYLGEPEKIETENSTPYTIEKYGTKHPVYKLKWKLPAGTRSYDVFPSDKNDYERKINRGEEWPNDDLAKLSLKILPGAGNYNANRMFTNSNGIYVKPNTGDVGIIGGDGRTTVSLSNVAYIELLNTLYKNIPEIKKLLPPKKAKEFGVTPQETRKLNLDPSNTWDDNQYYISSNKKPQGVNYQRSYRESTDLLPGTAYTIYYKNNNGDTRIMNTLYFPEKGPVVIFDGRGDKETYTTDQKIHRFVDKFPDLKAILEPFAKSNKWLKESAFEIIEHLLTESELVYDYFDETTIEEVDPYISLLENELAESLGDLAWAKKKSAEIKQAKKEWKPNYHFVKPGELQGSYTDQQMKDLGFKMASSGNWYMPQKKFQDLVKSGKLREDEQAILEGKKLPRTSEFLHVKQDLQRLAGISEDKNEGSNISVTGNEKAQIMKKHDIQPGTDDWFRLWFSKPYLTGETPYGD